MTRSDLVRALRRQLPERVELVDCERFVHEAAGEFDAEELWPWRITESTGAAPLTVSQLGPIDSVRDTERRVIFPRRHSELVEMRVDFTAAGGALYYYVEGSAVKTWPVSSVNITVRHYATGGWTAGGDSPASDADSPRADGRWHDVILTLAQLRARLWINDGAGAGQLWERYQARLEQARQAELQDNWDEPDVIRMTETY